MNASVTITQQTHTEGTGAEVQPNPLPVHPTRQPEIILKPELAARLKKSKRWVEIQCAAGRLPHIKLGRSVFFVWQDVMAKLREFEVR